jgi:GNAT superfamily N-acetyltransferase
VPSARPALADNPFAPRREEPVVNPFAPTGRSSGPAFNPFGDDDDEPAVNPFAPPPPARPTVGADVPRKLGLLARGLGVFGSYAKVALVDDVAVSYAQFGPLSAYPRAQRLRELYSQLPDAPLPAVITCIATTAAARGAGLATRLVGVVCDDLAKRGFAAVEAYPERGAPPDATSAATPEFWLAAGFTLAVDDARFPVVRRELV